jgi:hypothetical protein
MPLAFLYLAPLASRLCFPSAARSFLGGFCGFGGSDVLVGMDVVGAIAWGAGAFGAIAEVHIWVAKIRGAAYAARVVRCVRLTDRLGLLGHASLAAFDAQVDVVPEEQGEV